MEEITDYLLNLKEGPYMLPVTPEFKHITRVLLMVEGGNQVHVNLVYLKKLF